MAGNRNNEIWVFLSHSNKDKEKVLTSESGKFIIDGKGIVQRFEPSEDNPFIDDAAVVDSNRTYKIDKSIRTFIVPEGVKGFASDFMRGTQVVERFELSEGLISIGNNSFDIEKECHCVFANCILPEVVIPQSVQEIGNFAFGHSQIDMLQIPATLHSPYGRQFKDSHIRKLRLPKEWKDDVELGDYNELRLKGHRFNDERYGYLRCPSTTIETLEFY